jgi:alkanesulfonate monooxygenase SsuD/methylene tetrahydromethanopterin reductase-like flavin-dependent oxidoreductase (luciferase family)
MPPFEVSESDPRVILRSRVIIRVTVAMAASRLKEIVSWAVPRAAAVATLAITARCVEIPPLPFG